MKILIWNTRDKKICVQSDKKRCGWEIMLILLVYLIHDSVMTASISLHESVGAISPWHRSLPAYSEYPQCRGSVEWGSNIHIYSPGEFFKLITAKLNFIWPFTFWFVLKCFHFSQIWTLGVYHKRVKGFRNEHLKEYCCPPQPHQVPFFPISPSSFLGSLLEKWYHVVYFLLWLIIIILLNIIVLRFHPGW